MLEFYVHASSIRRLRQRTVQLETHVVHELLEHL